MPKEEFPSLAKRGGGDFGESGGFSEIFHIEEGRPGSICGSVIYFDQTTGGRRIIRKSDLIKEDPHLEIRQQCPLGIRQKVSHVDFHKSASVCPEEADGSAHPERRIKVAAFNGGWEKDRVY